MGRTGLMGPSGWDSGSLCVPLSLWQSVRPRARRFPLVSETGQWYSLPCRALWIQAARFEWNVKHISKPAKTRTAFFFPISISSEQRKNPTCHQLPVLVWRCGASHIISIRYLLSGSHESRAKERSFVGMTCLEIYLSKANSSCSFSS